MKRDKGQTLTRKKVLQAALKLMDKDGLEGFSMRKLGNELGVEAMSLYNHIENKEDLFDGVIEILLLQIPYPDNPNVTPYNELWTFSHAFREVLREHPRVLPLVATRPLRTYASLAIMERLLATFARANLSGLDSIYALNSLVGFIVGHELLDVGTVPVAGITRGPEYPLPWQHLQEDQYPTLHALTPYLKHWNPDKEFEFGLQSLLKSILAL
jgi:AcrR family transcriptional regulator